MKPTAENSSHRKFRVPVQAMTTGRLVGVIADRAAWRSALRLRRLPDLFELRLDSLGNCLDEIESALPRLRAPLIITARHPDEGGSGALSASARRDLLTRFLGHARYLDLELRSASELSALRAAARRRQVGLIISVHEFADTPEPAVLHQQLKRASTFHPEIFKVATRTDDPEQLERLLAFFRERSRGLPLAAMGMGKFALASRRQLLRMGSALNYAAIRTANAPGQPTLRNLHRTHAAYI